MSFEHDQLREVVREFLAQRAAPDRGDPGRGGSDRGGSETPVDERWRQMAGQLGLQGLALPEEHGGGGFGAVELGIVLEEMGRALFAGPFFATVVLAGLTLARSADQAAQRRWLPGIADGTLTGTLALTEESASWDVEDVTTTASPHGAAWEISGEKLFVLDGTTADLLLVVARGPDGPGVFAVESSADRSRLEALDGTRELAAIRFDQTPAVRIGEGRNTAEWLGEVYDRALAALASEQLGGAARCLELAVEYAKVREQFGRPIGSFQAIKHKCAELLVEVESARSAVYHANAALDAAEPDASVAAVVAKAYASETFTHAAKECIQIHGGIGFTWEHDAHRYLRRAKSSELLLGTPKEQRARLAELVGL